MAILKKMPNIIIKRVNGIPNPYEDPKHDDDDEDE